MAAVRACVRVWCLVKVTQNIIDQSLPISDNSELLQSNPRNV